MSHDTEGGNGNEAPKRKGQPSLLEQVMWRTSSVHFSETSDQFVLGVLLQFADYKTSPDLKREPGRHMRPSLDRLSKRCGIPRATLFRSVKRLVADGWLIVTYQAHREPTEFDLNIAKLNRSRFKEDQVLKSHHETQDQPPFESHHETQNPPDYNFESHGETFESHGDNPPSAYTLCTEHRTFVPPDQVVPTTKQRGEKTRRVTPDVEIVGSGWRTWPNREAMEADLASMPILGPFASPPLAQSLGYQIFDKHHGNDRETFMSLVRRLERALNDKHVATSEEQCRQAMADVYRSRQMKDRAWDPGEDRDRRKGGS